VVMELRHLRYFVAVAEEQNVTRAARRLHVSQPPLSRQIRDLEDELGLALFEHGGKSLKLTQAGSIFLPEARAALQRVDDAVAFTRAFVKRQRNCVRLGYGAVPAVEVLPLALHAFQKANPTAKVDLRTMTVQEMLRALSSGGIDVALMPYGLAEDFEGLAVEELVAYPLRVATSKQHRFARLREVPLAEVAKEPIILLSHDDFTWYDSLVRKLLSPYNRSFAVADEYDTSQSVFAAVESGLGVTIAYTIVARTAGDRLVFRPLKPEPQPLPVVLAYRKEAASPLIRQFVAAARTAKRA
jgi:DNA-binding transcriptional LysR family regulator